MNEQQKQGLRTLELYATLLTLEVETAPIRTEQRQEIGRFLLEQTRKIRSDAQAPIDHILNLRVLLQESQGSPAVAVIG